MARFFYLKINTLKFSALIDPRSFATFQILVSYTTSKNFQRAQLSVIANMKKEINFNFFKRFLIPGVEPVSC